MTNPEQKTILLVEDEAVTSIATAQKLKSFGYDVLTAATGKKAVEITLNGSSIDLILMDIDLGKGIDGTEAAIRILEKRTIPIVFLTSHSEKEYVDKVKKITRYGYIIKNSGDFVLQSSIEMAFELFGAHENITKELEAHKQTEKALRESEYFFKESQRAAFIGSYKTDFIAGYWKSSEILDQIFGIDEHYSRSVQGWLDLVHPDDKEHMNTYLVEEVIAQRKPFNHEYRIIRKSDNEVRWVHGLGEVGFDSKGSIISLIGTIQDITERKIIGEALTEANQFNTQIIQNAQEGIIVYDKDLRYKAWNPYMEKMSGFSSSEVSGKHPWDLFPFLKDTGVIENLEKALKGEIVKGVDFQFKVPETGKSGWNSDISAPLRNVKGEIVGVIGTVHDITEQKELENSLQAINERFISLADNIPGYIAYVNAKTLQYRFVNASFEKSFGMPRDEIIGSHIKDIIGESNYQFALNYINEVKLGKSVSYENIFNLISGKHWINVNYTPYLNNNGQVDAIIVMSYDITDRKQAEEALKKSENMLTFVMDGIPALIAYIDTDLRFVYLNKAHADWYGRTKENIAGKYIKDVLNPESFRQALPYYLKVLRGEEVIFENNSYDKDGRERYVSIRLIPHKSGERVMGFFAALINITERRMAENKIKLLLNEKDLLLKEIHHRVKNNMNTMRSLLSLQAASVKDPSASEALEDAGKRFQSMEVLYDKLYQSDNLGELSIKDYLSSLADEVVELFPNKNIVEISKQIGDFKVKAAKLSPLGIIINELLTNAMKYAFIGKDKGLITVTALKNENYVIITVSDNGVGIPQQFDINNSAGFGLQLVNMLTQQIGGTIKIDRQNGTKFTIEFDL